MARKIKVQKLTKEAFVECGTLIEVSADHQEATFESIAFPFKIDPEAGFLPVEGELQIMVVTWGKRPLVLDTMERHMGVYEMVAPLGKPMWLPAAPPSEPGRDKPDPDRIMVFEMRPDQAVIFKPGAWHFAPFVPEPLTSLSLLAMYSRGKLDVNMEQLKEPIEVVAP